MKQQGAFGQYLCQVKKFELLSFSTEHRFNLTFEEYCILLGL